MKEDQKNLVQSSLKTLAILEDVIKVIERQNVSNKDRTIKNIVEMCKLIEEFAYADEEYIEKNYKRWQEQVEARCDQFIGQSVLALQELKSKK
jgi:hypothetical protein